MMLALVVIALAAGCGGSSTNEFGADGYVSGSVRVCYPGKPCQSLPKTALISVVTRYASTNGRSTGGQTSAEFGWPQSPGTYVATLIPDHRDGLTARPIRYTVRKGKQTEIRLRYQ